MSDQTYKFYIGVDVSKHKLDVAISNNSSIVQSANNVFRFKELTKQLPNKKHSLIVLEASGGYEQSVANYLRSKKYNVAIVNAKRVRDFAKASGKLAKTDHIDANVIMAFAKAFNPVPQPLASPEEQERIDCLKRRSQVVEMIAREKQHLEKAPEALHREIQKHIRYLEKALEKIENFLKDRIKKDAKLQHKIEKLDEIKGVGIVTAMNVLLN